MTTQLKRLDETPVGIRDKSIMVSRKTWRKLCDKKMDMGLDNLESVIVYYMSFEKKINELLNEKEVKK